MAVTLNPGSGGEVIATEDIAGTDYQQVKLVDGTAASTTVIAAGGGVEAGALRVTVASDSTGVLSVDDNGGSLTVDAASLPLPTGAATAAAQLPDGHNVTVDNASGASAVNIQDGGNSITVDSADLSTIAGAVAGTEMQVDIVSGAPTEYTEDGVVPANPQGPAMVAERDDALSTLTPAAGDWTHLRTDSQGALWVNAVNADGTNNVGTAAGATDSGVPILAVRDDSLTTLTDPEGDYVPIRVNSTGAIHVTGGGGGTEYTEDDAAAANPSGGASILVRQDTPGAVTSADGDNVAQRGTNFGAAFCQIVDSSGNFIDTFGGSGGTASTDDGAFTAGTGQGTPMMGFASSDTVDAGDVGVVAMDTDRNLRVRQPDSVIDTGNSTTTPLGSSATFTGTGVDLLQYASVTVHIFADQNSVATGMHFEFSQDNTNWDRDVAGGFDYTASTSRQFTFSPQLRYFRVRYINGATAQGAFRIQTILHQSNLAINSIYRADDEVGEDRSMSVNKSILMGRSGGSGNFVNIATNAQGRLQVSSDADVSTLDGNTVDLGNGAVGAGTQRVTIASDTTGVLSVDDNGGSLTVDGSVSLAAAIPAGTNNIGDVDIASAIPAGTNVIGDVGISGARTTGGTTLYRNVDVDETEDQVKGTAGQIYWLHAMNMTAAVLYLQIYNATAASVTVGTTTPDLTFPLPTQGDTNGAGFTLAIPNGIALGTAITIAATTTIGGATGPAANGCIVNLGYA